MEHDLTLIEHSEAGQTVQNSQSFCNTGTFAPLLVHHLIT